MVIPYLYNYLDLVKLEAMLFNNLWLCKANYSIKHQYKTYGLIIV